MMKSAKLMLLFACVLLSPLESKEIPSDEILSKYERLKLGISQLESEITDKEMLLKNKRHEIKTKESMIEVLYRTLNDDKNIEPEVRDKLKIALKNLQKEKTSLQTELHLLEIESEIKLKDKNNVLKDKVALESKYLLIPIVAEFPLLKETVYRITDSVVGIGGKFVLNKSDDIDLSLVLSRTARPSFTFCEIYINDKFVKLESWVIGDKNEFKTKIRNNYDATFNKGKNTLKIIFKTFHKGIGETTNYPPFKESPLVIFKESKISSIGLVSADFELNYVDKIKK